MLHKKEKFVLFMTSYIPIWIIFLLKIFFIEKDEQNKFFFKSLFNINSVYLNLSVNLKNLIMILMIAVVLWTIYKIFKVLNPKCGTTSKIKIIRVNNISIDYITNYFSLYLFPFFTLEVINIVNVLIFIFIFIIASYIYIKNNIIYINPILNLIGYVIYEVEIQWSDRVEKAYFITFKERHDIVGEHEGLYLFEKNLYFEKKAKKI